MAATLRLQLRVLSGKNCSLCEPVIAAARAAASARALPAPDVVDVATLPRAEHEKYRYAIPVVELQLGGGAEPVVLFEPTRRKNLVSCAELLAAVDARAID